jgi:hypothetical protein
MRFRKIALWAAAMGVVQGCDCNRLSAQVSARKVMVATVLATPQIHLPPEAMAGWDGSFPSFDGGFFFDGGLPFDAGTFDAGGLVFDGGLTVPPQTAVFVFFGERTGEGLTQAPTPVGMAQLTAATALRTWTLRPQTSAGTHALTSLDDDSLSYQPNVTWTFTAMAEGQSFVGDVEDAPPPEVVSQLHPDAGYLELQRGTPITLTRPEPAVGERNLGFVTVFPISRDGSQGPPTYTNVPDEALEFLKLVAAPSEWKQSTVEIPGSAFPDPDRNYVILLQSAKLGGAKSENLFIGSAMIAGTADVGVVKTR